MDLFSYRIATINICNISNETKLDALRSFIRSADLDVIFLQEVHNEQLFVPGFTLYFNVDVHQRGTAIAVRNQFCVHHVEKSLDNRIISMRIGHVTFINIYAPSGALLRTAREDFFNSSVAHYLRHSTDYVVMGGDFNAIVNLKDATGSSNMSPMCKKLMNAAHLTDSWEILNGNRVEFSYIRSNTASRLDRILISNSMKSQVRTANFAVTSFADHKAYMIRMVLPHLGTPPGRGVWRLQTQILDNEEVLHELSRKWHNWVRAKSNYTTWMEWWIVHTKPKLISFLKWKTSIVHREFRDAIELYRSLLKNAYENYLNNPEQLIIINHIKAQMLRLQKQFSASFRKNNETFISGESTTLFHVAQIQAKKTKSTISRIDTDGGVLRDQSQIRSTTRSYFENLYDAVAPNACSSDFLPAKRIPENNVQNDNLMQPISQDEAFTAIKGSCSRKSPGIDGLPKEFYQKAWRIISFEFTNVINDALQGNSKKEFHDGIIVLVKKKGNDQTVHGYRPISLLNFDYKIFSRILKQRMHNLLPLVLSENQKCSNGNRSIYEATCCIYDKLCQLKHHRKNALLVSFDLDHAFDRVSHPFLRQTMLRMNFNPQFVDLLHLIWGRSFSRILINGHLTQEFQINRSVRQGDPLSMHLFVLYLQPLLDAIIQKIPSAVIKAYADDISIFLENERSLVNVVSMFENFGMISGAILNKRKTKAVMIGNVNLTAETEWLNIENFVNILGIQFGNNIKQAQKLNWQSVLNGLRSRLWLNHPRKLNLIQKTILINTYINSKAWYMASHLPITKGILNKIRTEIGKFIWHGQTLQRVAFANLILPKNRGGLNLHCPEIKSKALLLNRLLSLAPQLPFLSSFLENQDIPIPSMFNHITLVKAEIQQLPESIIDAPSSQRMYHHALAMRPDPGFVAAEQREWKVIFKHVHNKLLSSSQRSIWYMILHSKIKHGELLYRRGVIDNPYCDVCPEEPETVVHKLFRCQHVRDIWRYQRRELLRYESCLARLEPEEFIYPTLRNINHDSKQYIIKALAIYYTYLIETPENVIGLDNFTFYVNVNN